MRVSAYPLIVDRKIFEINGILKKLLAADRKNRDKPGKDIVDWIEMLYNSRRCPACLRWNRPDDLRFFKNSRLG
jgi:hypothetical protein